MRAVRGDIRGVWQSPAHQPAQQQVLERFQARWGELSLEKRTRLRAGAERWIHLSPE